MGSKVALEASSRVVPPLASSYVRTVLDKAIDGVGPLMSAAHSAEQRLQDEGGNVERAIGSLTRSHTTLAGIQGFLTNLGGITYAAATIPANIIGITVVQCHLVAGIAHLRGYDLEDPRVRNAVLTVMLGSDAIKALVKDGRLPSSPMVLATSPVHDPALDGRIDKEVAGEIFGRTIGRRAVVLVGRSVPLFGGAVGAGVDGYFTWQVGRYAQRELKQRRR